MVAGTQSEFRCLCFSYNRNSRGIVPSHAYSVIGAYEIDGEKILKLRNPWGKFEFKGDVNENNSMWKKQSNIDLVGGVSKGDDGVFFMTLEEFTDTFIALSVCFYKNEDIFPFTEVSI